MADDALGDRMKAFERLTKSALPRHELAILRVDGRAFSRYTRHLSAHDPEMMRAMQDVACELCGEIQGARMAYTQSDEISVLINPWSSPNSNAWFGGDLQKTVSVAASLAAATMTMASPWVFGGEYRRAQFDARAFALPATEANAYFVWRQLDANRNAVNSYAQDNFSPSALNGVKAADVREMLRRAGKPFEALPGYVQRGVVIAQQAEEIAPGLVRNRWRVEPTTPWFASDPSFVESRCVVVRESARMLAGVPEGGAA